MMRPSRALSPVMPTDESRLANEEQIARKKAHSRERSALNAQCQRQPMWKADEAYEFEGPGEGTVGMLDLFADNRRLILTSILISALARPRYRWWRHHDCHDSDKHCHAKQHVSSASACRCRKSPLPND